MSPPDADSVRTAAAAAGLRASIFEMDGMEHLVLSFPVPSRESLAALTPAEHAVLELVLRGWTNAQIARRRGTSPHTVANQVVAILRKLGLGSRYELATAMGRSTQVPASHK
jgi:DNA-binding NarL/FixJ family response regulator